MAKIPELYRQQLGLPQLTDPATGKVASLESHARIQERSLALDDAETIRALFKKQKQLEAILDSDDQSEPVKAEALRELEAIYQFQRKHAYRSNDAAQRTAETVRKSIRRLHQHLSKALDEKGSPHATLRAFAQHIDKHILTPSARYSSPGGAPARAGLAASLTYQPPQGISWAG